jgi:hypothetical protein
MATQTLRDQLRAYDESWQRNRSAPATASDIEEQVNLSLALLDVIKAADERRWKAIQSQKPVPRDLRARHLAEMHELYASWFEPCNDLLRAIDRIESQGERIELAERFRQQVELVSAKLDLDPNEFAQSLNDIDDGQTIPLAEVRDELRRRTHA